MNITDGHKIFSALRLAISLPLYIALIIKTVSAQQQPHWRLAKGTEGIPIADIDIYYSDPDTVYAYGDKFLISADKGETWKDITSSVNTDVGALKVDPFDSKRIYISSYGRDPDANDIYMTTDGGKTWKQLFFGRDYPAPVVEIDPIDLRTVYVGVGPGSIYRSSDRGETWEKITTPPASYPDFLNSLAIAPANDSVLFAAYVTGLFRSTDRGASWTKLPLDPGHWGISCVAVDPRNSDIVYACIFSRGLPPGGVYKSTDKGNSWFEMNNGLVSDDWQVQSIKVNPKVANELFVGTGSVQNRIFFRSLDAANSWSLFNAGLPDSGGVASVSLDTSNNRVLIAVRDWAETGIYIYDGLTSVHAPTEVPETFALFQNYPNPFNPSTSINYILPTKSFVTLKVYDALGRGLGVLVTEWQSAGEHVVKFDATRFTSGVYFYQITVIGIYSGEFSETKKMLLLR